MLTMTPSSQHDIVVKTTDSLGQEDVHDFSFTTSDANGLLASKTGPNTATLIAGPVQGEFTLTVTSTDEVSVTHLETVKIDDRSISSISVEFA